MFVARAVTCLAVVAACGGSSSTPHKRLQITYSLDSAKAVADKLDTVRADLAAALADQQLAATVTTSPDRITITPDGPSTSSAIGPLLTTNYRDVLVATTCDAGAAPGAICAQFVVSYAQTIHQAALAQAITTVRARLDAMKVPGASVVEKSGQIVIEVPAGNDRFSAQGAVIARGGRLELKVVDDGSDYMQRVYAQVDRGGAVTADVETWSTYSNQTHRDYYLMARDGEEQLPIDEAKRIGCLWRGDPVDGKVWCSLSGRRVIERYLAQLAAQDPSFRLPADHEIGFELDEPGYEAKDRRPYWRTYYLARPARLTGADIAKASTGEDANTRRPLVTLELTQGGGRKFAELTAEIAGKKLATIVDGTIKSAPVVMEQIRGGRIQITMGGNDAPRQTAEAAELAKVLQAGALPAPLLEESRVELP